MLITSVMPSSPPSKSTCKQKDQLMKLTCSLTKSSLDSLKINPSTTMSEELMLLHAIESPPTSKTPLLITRTRLLPTHKWETTTAKHSRKQKTMSDKPSRILRAMKKHSLKKRPPEINKTEFGNKKMVNTPKQLQLLMKHKN